MFRSSVYANHFRHADLLPVWSSGDAFGMGSPLPLFYQKVFYYISGTAVLITGSVKFSIVLSLALCMAVGAYGMRFCAQKLTDKKALWIAVPLAFLLSNYAFSDWLVRGAMAEFAAMMLVPWVLWWCLTLLMDKRPSLALIPILFLLINAHNITAVFALLPIMIAGIIFLKTEGLKGLKNTYKKFLKIGVGLVLVLLPELLLQKLFLPVYDPSKITQKGYLATGHYREFSEYFLTTNYTWLKTWTSMTVQIDLAILVPIVLGLVALVLLGLFKRASLIRLTKRVDWGVLSFLIFSTAAFLFLQHSSSRLVYENIKVLQFLQFPWRLLVYLTPLGLLIITYLFPRFYSGKYVPHIAVAWVACFVVLSPIHKPVQYEWLPSLRYMHQIPDGQSADYGGQLTGIGEYLPRVTGDSGELNTSETLDLYKRLGKEKQTVEVVSGGPCEVEKVPERVFESMKVGVVVQCDAPAEVALPISYNDFSVVRDVSRNENIEYSRGQPKDPRIVIRVRHAGRTAYEIRLPTAIQVLKRAL